MRINQIKNAQNFNGLYDNKLLLSGLEAVSDHGASFVAGISFVSALALRPLAISLTPNVKKENKKILSAESIASALTKFGVALSVSLPIERAIKKIDENKDSFLKKETIKNLSEKEYKFLTQTVKLGSNFISAIPKSILGVALIPVVADLLIFKKDKAKKEINNQISFEKYKQQVSFKGKGLSKIISSFMDSDLVQDFAKKYSKHDKDIAKNVSNLTDILLTTTSVLSVKNSKKIKKENKNVLIVNKILSTAISIFAGSGIDKFVQKISQSSLENFKKVNINNKKLLKYIEGINIIRPTAIFALIYYGIIPVITTLTSDKFAKDKQSLH